MEHTMIDTRRAGRAGAHEATSTMAEEAATRIASEGAASEAHAVELASTFAPSMEYQSALEADLRLLLGGAADAAGLGPDMLLTLLQNRMRDLDGQVSTIMTGLNERTTRAEGIGRELAQLRGVQGMIAREPYMNRDGNIDMNLGLQRNELDQLCNAAGIPSETADAIWAAHVMDTSPATAALGSVLNEMMPVEPGHQSAAARLSSRSGFDNEIDTTNLRLQDCNRGNELLMVKLQTAMDQRKQSVTMVTNMLASLRETNQSIVGNLR